MLHCISMKCNCKPPGSSQSSCTGCWRVIKHFWWKAWHCLSMDCPSSSNASGSPQGHKTGSWQIGLISPLFLLICSTILQKPLHLFCPIVSEGVGFLHTVFLWNKFLVFFSFLSVHLSLLSNMFSWNHLKGLIQTSTFSFLPFYITLKGHLCWQDSCMENGFHLLLKFCSSQSRTSCRL